MQIMNGGIGDGATQADPNTRSPPVELGGFHEIALGARGTRYSNRPGELCEELAKKEDGQRDHHLATSAGRMSFKSDGPVKRAVLPRPIWMPAEGPETIAPYMRPKAGL
jgi:hypothetical protein